MSRSSCGAQVVALVALVAAVGGCAKKPAAVDPVVRGRLAYVKYCATCHGPQANGYVADNAPSLRTSTFLASASDAFLRDGITRGRPGTAMAAFGRALGGPLLPAEVDALVAFLRVGAPPRVALPTHAPTGDAPRGKILYTAICMRCHGTPTQRSSAVHLANPILLATASDAFLRWAIEWGRPPTSMVPWRETLKPQQIDDLVAYLRSMAVPPGTPARPPSFGPPAPRSGPIVLNPKGREPTFTLKEDRYVSIDQVKAALDGKQRMVITDARAPSEYLNLHIAGAISTPYYDSSSLDDLPNDGTWILAYCACPHHVSGQVVDELRKRGFAHTAVIDEGVFAWQQKGYPVVAAPGMRPPPAPPPLHPVGPAAPALHPAVPPPVHPAVPVLHPATPPSH